MSATGIMLILGELSILLGVKPKLGAAIIAGFLVGVSPMIHDFWSIEDLNQRVNEMAHFSKNLALLGATLALAAVPEPWPVSAPVALPKARRHEFEEIEAA